MSALAISGTELMAQEIKYKVAPVYPPKLERPALSVSREALPKGTGGALPTYDGESFQINFAPGATQQVSDQQVRSMTDEVLKALNWKRSSEELTLTRKTTSAGARVEALEQETKRRQNEQQKRLTGKLGPLSKSTQTAVAARNQDYRDRASRPQDVTVFEQRVNGVPIESSGLRALVQPSKGLVALTGRVFNRVELGNSKKLSEAEATRLGNAYVSRSTRLSKGNAPKPELVILPYGRTMLYAWRMDVTAEEGAYRLWVDAATGKVLELEPQFAADSATGLVFNPDPNAAAAATQDFEVNAPQNNNYTLALAGKETFNNLGADGVSNGNITVASGGGSANFNVAPINGTVVDRTSSAGYNGQFQDVNAFSWVYNSTKNAETWGSQVFPCRSR